MSTIPYNSPKAICTANQIRSKLDSKLKLMLNEPRIVGPQDPYIIRAYEAGFFDEKTKDELLRITKYCDNVLLTSDFTDIEPFDTLLGWAKMIDEMKTTK